MVIKMDNGKIQIYTGDGKGKTTAAFGSVVRAYGNNMKIAVFQFLKGRETGEEKVCREILTKIFYEKVNIGEKFYIEMNEEEKRQTEYEVARAMKKIEKFTETGAYDIVILDEIICCADIGLIEKTEIEDILRRKSTNTEIVLTGRGAWSELREIADTVTEMKKIKHIFDKGIDARKGIEY